MTLTIRDLNLQVELPELPRSIPVAQLAAPTLEERRTSIDVIAGALGLDDLSPGETGHSLAFVGERGEIEYFPASGAVWARDAAAEAAHGDELRRWVGLEKSRTEDGTIYTLNRDTSRGLMEQANALVEAAGLVEREAMRPSIVLDQVEELDEEGQTIQSGAGTATVMTRYSVEGLPVMGAGAKTYIYMEPTRGDVHTTGVFHCWRRIADAHELHLRGVEHALEVGVLIDPELTMYHQKGARIEVTELTFGYLALPAMVPQSTLLPSFSVAGRVHLQDDKMEYFEFARYHHAVSVDEYGGLGLHSPQLGMAN
ncbi:MAG: hypothetical protein ABFR53_04535 [Actinomycetota bacterium]